MLPWEKKRMKKETAEWRSVGNSTAEKVFALIAPVKFKCHRQWPNALFFPFQVHLTYPVMTQHIITPRAFSANRAERGCEMHILAPAQPHIRAALKIAACVLISSLFVICGLLFFLWRGRNSKQQQRLFEQACVANGVSSKHLNGCCWGGCCAAAKGQSRACDRAEGSSPQAEPSFLL